MTQRGSAAPTARPAWYGPLASGLARTLPDFLPRQRWYAGKSMAIDRVRMLDACRISTSPLVVLCMVDVEDIDERHEAYALLIGLGNDQHDPAVLFPAQEPRGTWLIEAGLDEDALRRLLTEFDAPDRRETARGGAMRFTTIEETGEPALPVPPQASLIEPLGTDQSNTTLRIGVHRALKLFRRLIPGEHPEFEVGRFLTKRTSFRAFPRLRGAITYQPPQGQPLTLAVLQDFVESSAVGWDHVCRLTGEVRNGHPVLGELTGDIRVLGHTTAKLHMALASNRNIHAFAPEPVTATDRSRWLESLARRCSRVLHWMREHEHVVSDEQRAPLEHLMRDLVDDPQLLGLSRHRFEKIRVHGDYHLGQTLKTDTGFVIIDFEGEPGRSVAERRAKQCALKDIAGMLRSFDYALALAPDGPLADRAHEAAALRRAFLEGYDSLARGASFLPDDDEAIGRWIDFFELDKVVYEVEYELDHRPELAHVPLHALAQIVERVKP